MRIAISFLTIVLSFTVSILFAQCNCSSAGFAANCTESVTNFPDKPFLLTLVADYRQLKQNQSSEHHQHVGHSHDTATVTNAVMPVSLAFRYRFGKSWSGQIAQPVLQNSGSSGYHFGAGDASILVSYQHNFTEKIGLRSSAGMEIPSGQRSINKAEVLIQLGSGSWDPLLAGSLWYNTNHFFLVLTTYNKFTRDNWNADNFGNVFVQTAEAYFQTAPKGKHETKYRMGLQFNTESFGKMKDAGVREKASGGYVYWTGAAMQIETGKITIPVNFMFPIHQHWYGDTPNSIWRIRTGIQFNF